MYVFVRVCVCLDRLAAHILFISRGAINRLVVRGAPCLMPYLY